MFTEEQLMIISDFKREPGYIEVKCGCTSRKYGDTMGRLRVFPNGKFLINCECNKDCRKRNMTPYAFVRHSRRMGTSKWTNHIWVMIDEDKIPVCKTVLNKYYKHASNEANGSSISQRTRSFHRDEFVRCSRCKKERRFRLRSNEDCRIYHDALVKKRWKCADRPYDKISCEDEEERASRKCSRGCPRSPTCEGCTRCVCFGCLKCRFLGCNCRTCVDFVQNAEP